MFMLSQKITPNELYTIIWEELQNYKTNIKIREIGKVIRIGDGIARIHGLPDVMAGELLEFADPDKYCT